MNIFGERLKKPHPNGENIYSVVGIEGKKQAQELKKEKNGSCKKQ